MPTDIPLTDNAPSDRFCDLVMKGGITSGVVYPLAILELAKSYRFKNIGGTSAGAIAAVATAAAEYRRRNGSMAGFEALRALPAHLGETVGPGSRLLSLFQPSAATSRLFNALLSMLNRRSTGTRWLGGLLGFVRAYAAHAIGGAILGLVLDRGVVWATSQPSWLQAVLLALIGALAAVVWGVYRDVMTGLVPNGFGLCNGGPGLQHSGTPPALVPWLHQLIQSIAGRGPQEPPLTFKDLWHAPGFPPLWLEEVSGRARRSIDLRMFTSNLTHGRPYLLPLEDESSRLFFKASQLRAYFPEDVIDHMVAHARPYASASPGDPDTASAEPDLLELPGEDLPIVVAARLSLSFPLLISAVPLWAIDYQAKRGQRMLRPCWFSDGGICSNFPIHLFDGFLPRWPTFGITIGPRNPYRADVTTWLPETHTQGRGDGWNRFAQKPDALSQLGGFLTSIVTTAQNWNDATSTRMPGVRDRVVHVRLDTAEGGLNLNMPQPLIATLASYGEAAGAKLRDKFCPANATAGATPGWQEHRWVRFNILITSLRDRIQALRTASDLTHHAVPLRDQINDAISAAPLRGDGSSALTAAQAESLHTLLTALEAAEQAFADNQIAQPYRPVPEPSLRVRAPL